jgi:hypothetical protein
MKDPKNWLWLLLFGSIWGMSELWGGDLLYNSGIPLASVWLSAFAVFLLAVARGVVDKPGSSTAIGVVALLFKLAGAAPFYCHLLAIVMLGASFDVAASLILKRTDKPLLRRGLTGVIGTYIGYASFALLLTYVIRYSFWAEEGLPRVLNHIFVSGTLTAVAAAILFPLGFRVGADAGRVKARRPGWATAVAGFVVIVLWTLGQVAK